MISSLRRLYVWVLHWAHTAYAVPALFVLAFTESSFFPIPPDVLLLSLGLAVPARALRYAGICTLGSVVGGVFGYGIGYALWGMVAEWFFQWVPGFTPETFRHMQQLFVQYDFWIVFLAGFTPIPYKIITIGAGVFQLNFPIFLLASAVSRGLRFYLIAILIYYYGDQARNFIDQHFNKLTIAFSLLLIGGFAVVRYSF